MGQPLSAVPEARLAGVFLVVAVPTIGTMTAMSMGFFVAHDQSALSPLVSHEREK